MRLSAYKCLKIFPVFLLVFWSVSHAKQVYALSGCSVSSSPSSVTVDSSSNFTFNLTNSDQEATIQWVQISRPSSDFTITGGSGWDTSQSESAMTFTGGQIPADQSDTFTVTVTSGSQAVSGLNWSVSASENEDGSDAVSCSGSLGVSIVEGSTGLTISNITLEAGSTSAIVSWTTSFAASSFVEYGTTTSYGSSKSDSNLSTSHSLTMDGLSANTTYHYKLKSVDAESREATTSDYSFTTGAVGSTTTTTTTVTTEVVKTVTVTKLIKDSIPPSVSITSDMTQVFSASPILEGYISDNAGISSIEYSLDSGKNWIPVDKLDSPFKASSNFSFQPSYLIDGNYEVVVRATDPTGNLGTSKIYTLIYDRLAPKIGPILFSIGPTVLVPQNNGIVTILENSSINLNTSAVGGPVKMTYEILPIYSVNQIPENSEKDNSLSDLIKNVETGLWSGALKINKPGVYTLLIDAIDGADNRIKQKVAKISVIPNGQVADKEDRPIKDVNISLYTKDSQTDNYYLWDSQPYNQLNPQVTDENGNYQLSVPPGIYYLRLSKSGYESQMTEISEFSTNTFINAKFTLIKKPRLKIGPFELSWPTLQPKATPLELYIPVYDIKDDINIFKNKDIPQFTLPQVQTNIESLFYSSMIRGKPTVLTFLTSWYPNAGQTLANLEQLSQSGSIGAIVIMSQETLSHVKYMKDVGKYHVRFLVDSDGVYNEPFKVTSIPMYFFLDRKGYVMDVGFGELGVDEMRNKLGR